MLVRPSWNLSTRFWQVHFPVSLKSVIYMLEELKGDRFVDKQTRRLMFIVTTFNANLKLFALSEFVLEINAAGKVETHTWLKSIRMNMFVDATDFIRVILELTVLALMLYNTVTEYFVMRQVGYNAYFNFWNRSFK